MVNRQLMLTEQDTGKHFCAPVLPLGHTGFLLYGLTSLKQIVKIGAPQITSKIELPMVRKLNRLLYMSYSIYRN